MFMRLYNTPFIAFLLIVLVLIVRALLPANPALVLGEEIVLFSAGLIAGIRLPDLDLVIPGLSHRSAITHSCFPVLVLFDLNMLPLAAGLGLGMALHMASDLQPKSWTGGALIKLPYLGSIGFLSPFWLMGHVIGCIAVFMWVILEGNVQVPMGLVGICLIGSTWYFLQEEKRPLLPLLALGFSVLLVQAIQKSVISVAFSWQYVP